MRQVVLLNAAQRLCRCSVTTQDNQRTAHREKFPNSLPSVLVDHIERASSIGSTRIIAQVQIVVLGHQLADAFKDGQSAITRIEYSNGAQGVKEVEGLRR